MKGVDFPKNLAFGDVALHKEVTKRIKLKGDKLNDITFEVEIVQPHPYFRVTPTSGTIPANSVVFVEVTYVSITFGSSNMQIRLSVNRPSATTHLPSHSPHRHHHPHTHHGLHHHGHSPHSNSQGSINSLLPQIKSQAAVTHDPPKDCLVSANAVSGLIEQEELLKARRRIEEKLVDSIIQINNTLKHANQETSFSTIRLNTAPISYGFTQDSSLGNDRAKTRSGTARSSLYEHKRANTRGSTRNGANSLNSTSHSSTYANVLKEKLSSFNAELFDATGNTSINKRSTAGSKSRKDPVAVMLASTFHGTLNIQDALDKTVTNHKLITPQDDLSELDFFQRSHHAKTITADTILRDNSIMLGTKVFNKFPTRDNPATHIPKCKVKCRPSGPGSGAVFDAATEWMSAEFHRKYLLRLKKEEQKKKKAEDIKETNEK